MKRFPTFSVLALSLLVAAACRGSAPIDLTGSEASTVVTELRGSFHLPDGSPAAGAAVTARYGEQSTVTEADAQGRFHFPRWNVLAYPATVEGELVGERGHTWFGIVEVRTLGDGTSSAFAGDGELEHTTTLVGCVYRPDWIVDPPWCVIEGGGVKATFTTDHHGYFRVERWPSDAQPIVLRASAGSWPEVWAKVTTDPIGFSPEAAELDLGEIAVEELPEIPEGRGGVLGRER